MASNLKNSELALSLKSVRSLSKKMEKIIRELNKEGYRYEARQLMCANDIVMDIV